jgi:CubicO group peptidase (beta-lactamase class C family)
MVDIHGDVDEGFGAVADAFGANFENYGEVGAAFCLHVAGRNVVDVWAGIADTATGRPWERDTLCLHFSTTKGVAAICAALLYERGQLDYDAPVADYWPEFAQAGKEEVTVAQCMSHTAGLAAVDVDLTLDQVLAVDPVVDALARQAPLWEPGTVNGYHGLTYGWIVGEIVRRIDGRRIGQFLREEIAEPFGIDTFIGLPESEEARVARLEPAPRPTDPVMLEMMMKVMGPGTLGYRMLTMNGAMPPTPAEGEEMLFNTRAVHATEMPGANGISTARALSRLYASCVGDVDGKRLISDDTVKHIRAARSKGPDRCLVIEASWGLGFMRDMPFSPMLGPESFGHAGAGGSLAYGDLEAQVGYGYVMNQMGGGISGDPRTIALNDAVRVCL